MGAGKSGENWPVNPVTEAVAEALTWVAKVGGRIQVRWNDEAAVTPFGQMAFFIEFLNLTGLLQDRIDDRPLAYLSPNAPTERDLLGTWLLSILAGHRRYAHVTAIRGDGVNPDLLGMAKVVSEDALRRGLEKIDETAGVAWLREHLERSVLPLLKAPWILDVDTTVKVLYGKQDGAVVGYNPKKPGRPSHTYTSRPLLLTGIAEQTRHARPERLTITPMHGYGEQAKTLLLRVSRLLNTWARAAEQLNLKTVWQSVCDQVITILTGFNGRIPTLSPPDPSDIATA